MDAPAGTSNEGVTPAELRLAARNHAMPLEALRHPVTPVGLHYLLTHYDIPAIDPGGWELTVAGEVERPLRLSLDDLRAMPAVTRPVTFECAGNGRALLAPRPLSQPWVTEAVSTGEWTGVPLRTVLDDAGLRAEAVEILFTGLDRGLDGGVEQSYERSLPRDEALDDSVLLAYELNGAPLPSQHGFPLRLIVPGWYGMAHVKWLGAITALAEPFAGYQQSVAYRIYDVDGNPGAPVTRMLPRSLTIPPGVPDFMTRERFLDAGPCRLEGRAWSGRAPVTRVEVSVDGGTTWDAARLGEPVGEFAWRGWSYEWDARIPGHYVVCSRATDGAGNSQPVEPSWNLKGYANNGIEHVPVTVRER